MYKRGSLHWEAKAETFLGWRNYWTWLIYAWIRTEPYTRNYWDEEARYLWQDTRAKHGETREERFVIELASRIRDEYRRNAPLTTGIYADLMAGALSEIDWASIAGAYLHEVRQ